MPRITHTPTPVRMTILKSFFFFVKIRFQTSFILNNDGQIWSIRQDEVVPSNYISIIHHRRSLVHLYGFSSVDAVEVVCLCCASNPTSSSMLQSFIAVCLYTEHTMHTPSCPARVRHRCQYCRRLRSVRMILRICERFDPPFFGSSVGSSRQKVGRSVGMAHETCGAVSEQTSMSRRGLQHRGCTHSVTPVSQHCLRVSEATFHRFACSTIDIIISAHPSAG